MAFHRMFKKLKAAPTSPPVRPKRTNMMYSLGCGVSVHCTLNIVMPFSVPVKFDIVNRSVAITDAMNDRRRVREGKMLDSSRLKRTPPTGEPNATPTPAAIAAEKSSRRFASFLYCGKNFVSNCAQQTAMWIMGPSCPSAIPEATERIRPGILMISVLNVRTSGRTKPLRMVFTSGMPEPLAAGANCIRVAEQAAYAVPRLTETMNPIVGPDFSHAVQRPNGQCGSGLKSPSSQRPKRKEDNPPMPTSMHT
mmetsp:Transcript_25161/g.57832  ORF Transcript_25161/g.57832 Transcript_25161/m.57832 type:complete len:251 (+) Transcript_25161:1505-2257(+)